MSLFSKLLGKKEERLGFEKESLAAGMAAGSAKKSIDIIEENMRRVINILEERLPERALSHEQFEQVVKESSEVESDIAEIRNSLSKMPDLLNKLESIQNRLEALQESHKVIRSDSESLRPSQSMIRIYEKVKEMGEVSFRDLAEQLGMSVSGVRGLVSKGKNRGLNLETFIRDREGWVKVREQ